MPTQFFPTPSAFRIWLVANAATTTGLLVGFHKVGSGWPSMSWIESVDKALCFGWIDGVRRRIDDGAYSIRFTTRRATSIWSAVNIAKFEQLQAEGRMTAAGVEAYAHRKAHKSAVYSHEQAHTAELAPLELAAFQSDAAACAFFQATPPGYKKVMLHCVTFAKKTETRAARLARLQQACAAGERLR